MFMRRFDAYVDVFTGKDSFVDANIGIKTAHTRRVCGHALDIARSLVYSTCLAIDSGRTNPGRIRRMVSQSKKYTSEAAWEVANKCMQVVGGIGYTDIYPLERILRDIRLSMIWVGTNEIMQLIIQTEWYKEYENSLAQTNVRDVEADSPNAHKVEEKVYE